MLREVLAGCKVPGQIVESPGLCEHNAPSRYDHALHFSVGEVAERLNALVLKTSKG